ARRVHDPVATRRPRRRRVEAVCEPDALARRERLYDHGAALVLRREAAEERKAPAVRREARVLAVRSELAEAGAVGADEPELPRRAVRGRRVAVRSADGGERDRAAVRREAGVVDPPAHGGDRLAVYAQ